MIELSVNEITEFHHRSILPLKLEDIPADSWLHWDDFRSEGDTEAAEFDFYWVDLAAAGPNLTAGLDALLPTLRNDLKMSGYRLICGKLHWIFHSKNQRRTDNQQSRGKQQTGRERTVARFKRFHDIHKHHRYLPEQLDQAG